MRVTTHEVGLDPLDQLSEVDSLCLFVAEDVRPLPGLAGYLDWRLCGDLSRILQEHFFRGGAGEMLLLPSRGRVAMPRVFAVGIGRASQLSAPMLAGMMAGTARMLARAGAGSVALEVPGAGVLNDSSRAEAVTAHFLPNFSGSRVAVIAERGVRALVEGAAAPVKGAHAT